MKIIAKPSIFQNMAKDLKYSGKTIGLVPTMGALHQGHASLIKRARKENDIVVVSIFVNPMQFNPGEDYRRYPRTPDKDSSLCRQLGVDFIFVPKPEMLYPKYYFSFINVENIGDVMCGKSRPGHFRGVATVVGKLFNIVMPDKSYFGLKDYQQSVVIKKFTEDLNFPVKIVTCPIIREKDGLALSSRNAYLSADERSRAISIYKSLQKAKNMIKYKKNVSARSIVSVIERMIINSADKIDYIEVRDASTLDSIQRINGSRKIVIAVAAYFGKTRLIDNILINGV